MRTSLLAFGNYLHQGEILFQILSLKLLKMTFFYLPIMDGSLRYFQVPKHLETPRNMKTLSLIWCWVVLLKKIFDFAKFTARPYAFSKSAQDMLKLLNFIISSPEKKISSANNKCVRTWAPLHTLMP